MDLKLISRNVEETLNQFVDSNFSILFLENKIKEYDEIAYNLCISYPNVSFKGRPYYKGNGNLSYEQLKDYLHNICNYILHFIIKI